VFEFLGSESEVAQKERGFCIVYLKPEEGRNFFYAAVFFSET
jgi:hypothetical protein